MTSNLADCEIHVECDLLSSHIYQDRYYNLSIFLKCKGVPAKLTRDNEIELITSIISSDTQQTLASNDFIIDNPSRFNKSGYTSSKFKIMSLPQALQSYRIRCNVPNSPVKSWISPPFTVVFSHYFIVPFPSISASLRPVRFQHILFSFLCY